MFRPSLLRRLLLLIMLAVAMPAAAQNFPQLTGRVVDTADMLSPSEEAALTQKLEALEQSTHRQLVVATVPDLQGYAIEDYGVELGRTWKIGQKDANPSPGDACNGHTGELTQPPPQP